MMYYGWICGKQMKMIATEIQLVIKAGNLYTYIYNIITIFSDLKTIDFY